MTWEEFRAQVRNAANIAADKLNQSADIAAMQFRVSSAERRLNDAYCALGRVAFDHFTKEEEQDPQPIATALQAVTLMQKELQSLREQLAKMKEKNVGESEKKTEPPTEA